MSVTARVNSVWRSARGSLSWGINSWARTIGPATSWGKKAR